MKDKRHMFIDFEGVDTCGKTTQIRLLKPLMPNAFFTKEPGSEHDSVCQAIRNILLDPDLVLEPETEALLYAADRVQHYKLLDKVLDNQHAVCDRSIFSSMAYQPAHGTMSITDILDINSRVPNTVFPDVVFYLKLPVEEVIKRLSDKEQDRIEQFGEEFFAKTIENYDIIFNGLYEAVPEVKIFEIDATLPIEEIHDKIKTTLTQMEII